MEFKLSCFKCGGTTFTGELYSSSVVDNKYYLLEDDQKQLVKCGKCGLEDYMFNLVPTAR